MNVGLKNRMSVCATMVSNEFIDRYMAAANGEYVKVFLYLLRHEAEELSVSMIADALNHTESDVKRALAYWKDAGVLADADAAEETQRGPGMEYEAAWAAGPRLPQKSSVGEESAATTSLEGRFGDYDRTGGAPASFGNAVTDAGAGGQLPKIPDPGNGVERMKRLADDAEFPALLYAVQQYLGKTFTQIECDKLAYFYDGLQMSADLLEYLAEYCADGGHTSIRYIEKVALNWYQMGITTREEARDYTMRYSRDMSAVMKAFGITNRNPGTAELEFMKKWFKEYGFDGTLVTEACNRTITATGSASFPYADKILSGWKANGVKTMSDVKESDKRRQQQQTKAQEKSQGGVSGDSRGGYRGGKKQAPAGNNRFRNFEERSYNYEDLVWEGMRKRQRGGSDDGTQ